MSERLLSIMDYLLSECRGLHVWVIVFKMLLVTYEIFKRN